jgi:flavin-dependent dehydrogenase
LPIKNKQKKFTPEKNPRWPAKRQNGPKLQNNSRVAVIGGGPAGSLFSYFLQEMAERVGLAVKVDIYEPRDFNLTGPPGCNMCGGVISESLVQILASEGIILPPSVIRRGIDSYVFHTEYGSVLIRTPINERRIGAVYRGAGPSGTVGEKWGSFDGFLLGLAQKKGARVIRERVDGVSLEEGYPRLRTRTGTTHSYDLMIVAAGVNTGMQKLLKDFTADYIPPATTRTYVCEYFLGEKEEDEQLGNSMHTFLLNMPQLEFAALIPKGQFATICILGKAIDKTLIRSFLDDPEVKTRFPSGWKYDEEVCRCTPNINIKASKRPFADRILFVGDSGVSRLYKDGIGAAYRTAKAAVKVVLFEGISEKDFRRHYWPVCRAIESDNRIGKLIFFLVRTFQKRSFVKKAALRMVFLEQKREGRPQRMSMIIWDLFTGSSSYREIFLRFGHPLFILGYLWNVIFTILPFSRQIWMEEA